MLHSLTVALAFPGKQSHTNKEPGSFRGLALQTIEGVASFTIVADCAAQLWEGIRPGSNGAVVVLRRIAPSRAEALRKTDARGPES